MEGHPEIHGKVPCAECHALMWISLKEDGSTGVELYEQHLHEVYEKKATEAVEAATGGAGAAQAPAAGRSSGIGMLLAAAVVAAVVSFAVTSMRGGEDAKKKPAGTDTALSGRLDALRGELQTAIGVAGEARAKMAHSLSTLQASAAEHAAALAAVPRDGGGAATADLEAFKAEVAKALANYTELNGRIEANYTNLRLALKRLDALEGN
jgi:hypothetical protein